MPTRPACCATRPGRTTYSNVENFISDALVFQQIWADRRAGPLSTSTTATRRARRGATRRAICAGWATCPATPTTRRPWAPPLAFEHQRLGGIRDRPVAGRQAAWSSPPGCAGSGSSCRRRSPRSNPELPLTKSCPAWATTGVRGGPGRGKRRKTLAGAAAGLRNVLWAHGEPGAGDGADPDRLAQRRPELLHAAHRQPELPAALRRFLTFGGEPGSVVKPGAVEFAPNFRNPRCTRPSQPWKRRCPATWR
jgi:hypothetical protein